MFNAVNGPKNFPAATSAQLSTVQNVYALLTGRVTSIGGTAWLNETTNKYAYNGPSVFRGHMRELGLYAADSWRVRPGLTLNFGLRWELQFPFAPLNSVLTHNTIADLWGVSGIGNLFKPNVMSGWIYGWAGRYDESIAGFKRVLELRPDSAETHAALAMTYARQHRSSEAIAAADRARELVAPGERIAMDVCLAPASAQGASPWASRAPGSLPCASRSRNSGDVRECCLDDDFAPIHSPHWPKSGLSSSLPLSPTAIRINRRHSHKNSMAICF